MGNAIHLLTENISQLVTETRQANLIFALVFLFKNPSESKMSKLLLLATSYVHFEM